MLRKKLSGGNYLKKKKCTLAVKPLNNIYMFFGSNNKILINRLNKNYIRYSVEMCKLKY